MDFLLYSLSLFFFSFEAPYSPWASGEGEQSRRQAIIDRSKLPTAPRAAREQAQLDPSRFPKQPPYTAFIGNCPYDVEVEDIEEFFKRAKVN